MLVAALSRSSAFAWLPNESFPLNTVFGGLAAAYAVFSV